MPKFTVIDKSGMSYSIEADYVLPATDQCDIVAFVNRNETFTGDRIVAQFQLPNIAGFFNNNSGSIKERTNED